MKDLFVTADLHLGHENIRRHTSRPFKDVAEMDEALIKNWNDIVPRGGTTIIVGDFAWKNHTKYLSRLNGKKILIVGNHDKMNQVALKQFTEVHQILCRTIGKKYVIFCHYPMLSWPSSNHGSWHIHGHCHGRLKEFDTILRTDVGVDVWDFKPVAWDTICKKMQAREVSRKAALQDKKIQIDSGYEVAINKSSNTSMVNNGNT